jgi:hypothetical protein
MNGNNKCQRLTYLVSQTTPTLLLTIVSGAMSLMVTWQHNEIHRLSSPWRTTPHNDPHRHSTTTPHANEPKYSENHPQSSNTNPTPFTPYHSTVVSAHYATTIPTTTLSAQRPVNGQRPTTSKYGDERAHTPCIRMNIFLHCEYCNFLMILRCLSCHFWSDFSDGLPMD